jgi:small subunit ribosomal protein S5
MHMSEDKKIKSTETTGPGLDSKAAATVASDIYGGGAKPGFRPRGGAGRPGRRDEKPKEEFEQRILEVARVTRVMAGGKRMNFRACVAIGDKKGNVGVGLGKGADVTMAVNKAVNHAKKTMIKVPLVNETIPHALFHKYGAAKIMFKPARKGKGVISGGVARVILELAGVKNVTTKTLGTGNKINNARCVIEALNSLRKVEKSEKDSAAVKTENKVVENKETDKTGAATAN